MALIYEVSAPYREATTEIQIEAHVEQTPGVRRGGPCVKSLGTPLKGGIPIIQKPVTATQIKKSAPASARKVAVVRRGRGGGLHLNIHESGSRRPAGLQHYGCRGAWIRIFKGSKSGSLSCL